MCVKSGDCCKHTGTDPFTLLMKTQNVHEVHSVDKASERETRRAIRTLSYAPALEAEACCVSELSMASIHTDVSAIK